MRARARAHARGGVVALPAPGGLAVGVLQALAGLSRHRWLDRLIRGRAWIGLVAFALIGIVAMQLWVVNLGVGIGRALEHEALLARENATLSIEDAKLSSGERVERMAAARGMVVAGPGALRFETVRGGLDARLAAAALARGGQVASAGTGAGTAAASSAPTETAASLSASAAATASSETPAASATGSTESSGEGATSSGEGSAASSEGAAPASGTSSGVAGSVPASGESSAPAVTSTSSGGATPTSGEAASSGEAAPVSGTGAVSAAGGTQQPSAGG